MEQKYSLFLLERIIFIETGVVGNFGDSLSQKCCIHIDTFDTLKEAKSAQKEYKEETIILISY